MEKNLNIWSDGNKRCAVIPLGVPLNQKYNTHFNKKTGKATFRSSDKDVAFKQQVHLLKSCFGKKINPIPKYMKGKRLVDKNVTMQIYIYDVDNRRDIDATEKSILDAMNWILYESDKQVWEKITIQLIDKQNPRVEIVCEERVRYENHNTIQENHVIRT